MKKSFGRRLGVSSATRGVSECAKVRTKLVARAYRVQARVHALQVCSATGCPDLAETRANNPFSAPAGTTLHHFYCRSTAGGHMAWQWTPAT